MLGSTPLTAILGAAPDSRDHDRVRGYIKELCNAGLAVLLCYPGTKKPFDGRTIRQKNAADKLAQTEAQAAGRRGWQKAKGPSGLALATTDHKPLTKKGGYLDEYIRVFSTWRDADGEIVTATAKNQAELTMTGPAAVNIAIEVGQSGLIVVDCDTEAQKHKFLEASGAPEDMPPTVISPGTRAEDGTWIHEQNCGHYYFTAPEGWERPTNTGSLTWAGGDGFAVLWDRRYVLIPPSSRKEGAYELAGRDYPAEMLPMLIEAIESRAAAKLERAHDNNTPPEDDLGKAINEWAETVPWADILEPLGWTQTARPDQCGCDVWTAPGDHASPKSATAHDGSCGLHRYTEVNAPLHIWTDNPGAPFDENVDSDGHLIKTVSKLQAVAWSSYGGDIGKTMDALDLSSAPDELSRDMGIDNRNIVAADDSHDPAEDIVLPTADEFGAEPEVDQFGSHSNVLSIRCAGCNQVVPKASVLSGSGEFEQDADGEWWHAEYDEEGNIDGGHMLVDPLAETAEPLPPEPSDQSPQPSDASSDQTADEDSPFATPGDDDEPANPDIFETGLSGLPIIAPFSHWRDMPPPEYIVEGLLEHGGLSCMIGKPGVGKSGVALDMALSIATGRPWQGRKTLKTRVMYLPGEGLSGAVQRIKAWSHMHDIPHELVDDGLRLGNDIIRVGASSEAWGLLVEYIIRQRIGLVIFDTFARMATGIEENSATEVGKAIVRLDNVRKLTGAGAMLIHHTAKGDPKSGRGSSALNGALDSELLISDATWTFEDMGFDESLGGDQIPAGKPLELSTTKQKNAEQLDDPIPLLMRNCAEYSAPYITGPTGEVDPMLGDVILARPRPEPLVETAIRINEFLRQFTDLHPTKAEIAAGVQPDPYTKSRTDSARAWKQTINLAIDMGMRYGLIDHPVNDNDTVLTSKFVIGGETAENARSAHARAVLADSED